MIGKGFIIEQDYGSIINRKKAKGYKSIEIDSNVKVPCMISIETRDLDNEPKLVIVPSNETTKKPIYMFLCKEFGLAGYAAKFENKISVIFCDDNLMLVTLHKGAIAVNTPDGLNLFTVDTPTVPSFDRENITWVNADKLKSYVSYYKLQSKFMYDFEFMFNLSGGKLGNLNSISLKHLENEDIDMSLGAFALELVNHPELKDDRDKIEQESKKQKALDRYFKSKQKE